MTTTTKKLHKNSLLSAHRGEQANPYLWSSPKWCAWEAIEIMKSMKRDIFDVWPGRGCTVNVLTSEGPVNVNVLP